MRQLLTSLIISTLTLMATSALSAQETPTKPVAEAPLAPKVGVYPVADGALKLQVTILDGQPEGPKGIPLNRLTSLKVTVTDKAGKAPTKPVTDLVFDARMPDHNHGMMVKPKVTALAPNEFRVDGVKLHMVGYWELHFTLKHGADLVKTREPFDL